MDSNKNSTMTLGLLPDGRVHNLSMNVSENPKLLSIVISDKITKEEWSCRYDAKFIEDLTKRTGSFKYFDVFVTMIKSALMKNTETVTLDLMTLAELKLLKNKKNQNHGKGTSKTKPIVVIAPEVNDEEDSDSYKKYLIVTYTTEFDKVHYPIFLNYSGPPDPLVIKNNIRKLMAEVAHLRSVNSELSSELKRIKMQESEEDVSGNFSFTGQMSNERFGQDLWTEKIGQGLSSETTNDCQSKFDAQSLQNLMNTIHDLDESTKDKCLDLVSENNIGQVQENLKNIKPSEMNLKARVEKLELALKSGPLCPPYCPTSRLNPTVAAARQIYRRPISLVRAKTGMDISPGGLHQTQMKASEDCSNSPEEIDQAKLLTTITAGAKSCFAPRFNPTAYIQAKKERDKKLQIKRLSQKEFRFRGSRISAEGRGKGRDQKFNKRASDSNVASNSKYKNFYSTIPNTSADADDNETSEEMSYDALGPRAGGLRKHSLSWEYWMRSLQRHRGQYIAAPIGDNYKPSQPAPIQQTKGDSDSGSPQEVSKPELSAAAAIKTDTTNNSAILSTEQLTDPNPKPHPNLLTNHSIVACSIH